MSIQIKDLKEHQIVYGGQPNLSWEDGFDSDVVKLEVVKRRSVGFNMSSTIFVPIILNLIEKSPRPLMGIFHLKISLIGSPS